MCVIGANEQEGDKQCHILYIATISEDDWKKSCM